MTAIINAARKCVVVSATFDVTIWRCVLACGAIARVAGKCGHRPARAICPKCPTACGAKSPGGRICTKKHGHTTKSSDRVRRHEDSYGHWFDPQPQPALESLGSALEDA